MPVERTLPGGLSRTPFAPSSTQATVNRCKAILYGNKMLEMDLPRSGPWKHAMMKPHAIPAYLGRTRHRDTWRVGLPDSRPSTGRGEMSRTEWEDWHMRRASKGASDHNMWGHAYLPIGNAERTSTSSGSSRPDSSIPRDSIRNSREIKTSLMPYNNGRRPYSQGSRQLSVRTQ